MPDDNQPVGLTKDSGWQIGVRRTLPVGLQAAWQLLTSPAGLALWLGEIEQLELKPGGSYKLANGAHGQISIFTPYSHMRLSYQPGDWPRAATTQLRVLPKGGKTVVAFHQEHLPGAAEREQQRAFFTAALNGLERLIAQGE